MQWAQAKRAAGEAFGMGPSDGKKDLWAVEAETRASKGAGRS